MKSVNFTKFNDYYKEYKEFYDGVLRLARMDDKFSEREATFEEAKEYQSLYNSIISDCQNKIRIEDLIGLVVVGEFRKNQKNQK